MQARTIVAVVTIATSLFASAAAKADILTIGLAGETLSGQDPSGVFGVPGRDFKALPGVFNSFSLIYTVDISKGVFTSANIPSYIPPGPGIAFYPAPGPSFVGPGAAVLTIDGKSVVVTGIVSLAITQGSETTLSLGTGAPNAFFSQSISGIFTHVEETPPAIFGDLFHQPTSWLTGTASDTFFIGDAYGQLLVSEFSESLAPAVPESSTWLMLLIGFVGIGFIAYSRRDQTNAFVAPVQSRLRMRNAIVGALFLVLSPLALNSSAMASTYDIDLTNVIGTTQSSGPCYCRTNFFFSPIFSAQPGDVFNFGHVQLYAFQTGVTPDAGPNQTLPWLISTVGVNYVPGATPVGVLGLPYINFFLFVPPFSSFAVNLEFVVPLGGSEIQIDFAGPEYSYIPGVPEPSTWAMLLIGFSGMSLLTHSRSRRRLVGNFKPMSPLLRRQTRPQRSG